MIGQAVHGNTAAKTGVRGAKQEDDGFMDALRGAAANVWDEPN